MAMALRRAGLEVEGGLVLDALVRVSQLETSSAACAALAVKDP